MAKTGTIGAVMTGKFKGVSDGTGTFGESPAGKNAGTAMGTIGNIGKEVIFKTSDKGYLILQRCKGLSVDGGHHIPG